MFKQKTLFFFSLLCILSLLVIPYFRWIPSAVIPVYCLYGIITITFFCLLFILFRKSKLGFRIVLIIEAFATIVICYISLIFFTFDFYIDHTDDIYFYNCEPMEGIGFDLSISERCGILPICIEKLRIKNFNDWNPQYIQITNRNDSIIIYNPEEQKLYYLQHSLSDDWQLINIK